MFTGTLTYQTIEHTHVSHAASYNYYSKHQCTWWAYKRRVQLGKPVSNRWGNARNWYYNARRSGYSTGHKPKIRCYAIYCRLLWARGNCRKFTIVEALKSQSIIIMFL